MNVHKILSVSLDLAYTPTSEQYVLSLSFILQAAGVWNVAHTFFCGRWVTISGDRIGVSMAFCNCNASGGKMLLGLDYCR